MKASSSLLLVGSAVVFTALAVAACSSDSDNKTGATGGDGGTSSSSSSSSGGGAQFSCNYKSKCANEPAPTQTNIDACNELLSGPCGTQYRAYGNCGVQNEKCKGDGTYDLEGTKAACNTTWVEFSDCVTSKLADAGSEGDGGSI